MPVQDKDKLTAVLLGEIKAGVPSNLTAVHAKLDELINFRIINDGDSDEIEQGGVELTKGGIRPEHAPRN